MYQHYPPFDYKELYLYSVKKWEMAPSGVSSYDLSSAVMQNAPVVITSSGHETTKSSDPWAQTTGDNKYNKVGFGDFSVLASGLVDASKYEFALYPESSGTIVFNSPIKENVYIEYESGPSGYYISTSEDINPVFNEVSGGFIHFAASLNPGSIYVSSNKAMINADGSSFARITATAYDANFERVPGVGVIFMVPDSLMGTLKPERGTVYSVDPSGYTVGVREVTNGNGVARATYFPTYGQSGDSVVYASWDGDTVNVSNFVIIEQFAYILGPFQMDVSNLDGFNYLT